jgi:hypothetical protein
LYPSVCLYNPGDIVSIREVTDPSMVGKNLSGMNAIDSNSPLRYHRSSSMLYCPGNFSILLLIN